jgi:FkbM family methyltransferase
MSIRTRIINTLIKGINEKEANNTIRNIAYTKKISLLFTAYRDMGIHNFGDEISGENFFIAHTLVELFKGKKELTFFDVGANVGNYTQGLLSVFPEATIHCFEPVQDTFFKLTQTLGSNKNTMLNKAALGNERGTAMIYHYNNSAQNNEHGSLHRGVITDLHFQKNVVAEEISILTVDDYCLEKGIHNIDFLKIDTEGNEYSVLQGAKNMLAANNIDVIQFEFNEMNVISRVFLKDFYELLKGYNFYRLQTDSLIPLGPYNSINEVFQFQNIIAMRN